MPTITVPTGGANYSLYSRLKLVRATETPNFLESCAIQADAANTSDLKVGDSAMTATDYDELIAAGESAPLRSNGNIVLSQVYVRNDGADTLKVNLKYTAM